MKKGILFILTAPSGCGKGTLRRALLDQVPDIKFYPSLTTRPPRSGEVNGVDYVFVSREEFLMRKDRGDLVEWAEVYGNLYGTPREDMEKALSQGQDVILEKDINGARTLKMHYPDGVFIFILPPSFEELRRRMEARGTENEDQKRIRLESARREMSDLSTFDYVIINSDVTRACQRLVAIVTGERARRDIQDQNSVRRCVAPQPQRRSADDESTPKGPGEESRFQVHPGDCRGQKSPADCSQERTSDFPGTEAGNYSFGGDCTGQG